MLNSLEIPCMVVSGYVGTIKEGATKQEYPSNHVWNMVYYDKKWHYMDVTWDSLNKYYG